ncbi:hypothetical protein Tdes44962_MAKER01953 [Teratosphaeria destructans]|uniref:Uncharacterized protein n=1 Tax=Teratosphaeria destructans TaxID=418781 RepID=A0A9W7SVV2_9PEZI|nr:hypothetical protein Tdes44962_MAKER01953 [Teratosphaeria destructans]
MSHDGDEQHLVARGEHRDAVEARIPHRVHGVRGQLEDAVERQLLVDQEEEVSPVPGEVFDDAMGVQLHPQVEEDQQPAADPPSDGHGELLGRWCATTGDGEQDVGSEIAHENEVHHPPEQQPCVELQRRILKLVVLGNLGFHLFLEESVQLRMRVLAGVWLLQDPGLLGPDGEALVVGLVVQEPADAEVVARPPEEEDDGEDGDPNARGQDIAETTQGEQHSHNGQV